MTIKLALRLTLVAGVTAVGTTQAQSNNAILDALVQKGVITEAEADQMRRDANERYAAADSDELPGWVKSLNFKGDLRTRYEQKHNAIEGGKPTRHRFRYRLRFGFTADMQNDLFTGVRLASGSTSNPNSTNQTLDDPGHNDTINIDQAYAGWKGLKNFGFLAGKLPAHDKVGKISGTTGWMINKALIDSDVTPEGLELHYDIKPADTTTIGLNFGGYIMNENSGTGGADDDSYMLMTQAVLKQKLTGTLDAALGVGVATIGAVDTLGEHLHDDNGGNTRSGNNPANGFTTAMYDASLTYKGWTYPIKLSGSLFDNTQVSEKDGGYSVGLKIGSAKKAGEWELGYEFRELEADVFYDQLTDSDLGATGIKSATSYHNGTNTKGHIFKAKYNIFDNWQAAFTLLRTDPVAAVSGFNTNNEPTTRIQADLIWKF